MTSSPLRPGAGLEEELEYYKKQYEQLEGDLADFQTSSKELEEQLERDIDAAEKNERKLKEQVERLGFEVEEWKGKHKQAKGESNNAQNALQKEITTMREQNRGLQLRLRDIEVANDDYERQARNTTSSLEDLDGKLNMAIERGVLMDEEVKTGEKEREGLRIENQRLRDELGDLKVESEITLEKLRLAGKTIETLRTRKPGNLAVQNLRATSPGSEASGVTPSSPTASTPPPKSDTASEAATPPSPPLSDEATANGKTEPKTPLPGKRRSLIPDAGFTPRPWMHGARAAPSRHARGPSVASSYSNTTSDARALRQSVSKTKTLSPPGAAAAASLPRSESLYQMKSLRSRMQKIEERVHSARSKLPAPRDSTPRASPRAASMLGSGNGQLSSSITVRRTSRRPSSAATSTVVDDTTPTGARDQPRTGSRESQSHVKRLSYGVIPRPPSRSSTAGERPASRASMLERPPSAAASRPSSRLSIARPESRAGMHSEIGGVGGGGGGVARSLTTAAAAADRRPRSSMGGGYATVHGTPRSHRPSASISELRRRAGESGEESDLQTRMFGSHRRTTMDRGGVISSATAARVARRQSNAALATGPTGGTAGGTTTSAAAAVTPGTKGLGRRTSMAGVREGGEMRPPASRRRAGEVRDASEVGETF